MTMTKDYDYDYDYSKEINFTVFFGILLTWDILFLSF